MLQSVINLATQLVFNTCVKVDHVTPQSAHALVTSLQAEGSGADRVQTRRPCVYRCLHGTAPPYVDASPTPDSVFDALSASECPPYYARLSIVADRAFPVAGPRVWNALPQHVTSFPFTSCFPQSPEDISSHTAMPNVQLSSSRAVTTPFWTL